MKTEIIETHDKTFKLVDDDDVISVIDVDFTRGLNDECLHITLVNGSYTLLQAEAIIANIQAGIDAHDAYREDTL